MVLAVLITLLGFLIFAKPVLAVTVTTSNIPSTITDQSFNFNVSITGAGAGTNYLRVDLYKDGTFNYFGDTYNGTIWYNGSAGTQYYPIVIVSGQTWSGSVQGRLGSPSSGDYPGPGAYKLKIRRYTNSGKASTGDTQTSRDISITYTAPTPSPTPTTSSSSSSTSDFSISGVPSQINSNQIFATSVSINLSSSPNTKFYLKGAFRSPSKPDNYFGLTQVGSSWIKNSDSATNQFSATTDSSGSWSGNINIQPDILDSGYLGSGDYNFKVGRYTGSGDGPTWSNEVAIKIIAQEIQSDSATLNSLNSQTKSQSEVLGKSNEIADLPQSVYNLENYKRVSTPSTGAGLAIESNKKTSQNQFNFLPVVGGILILSGLGFGGFLFWKNRVK